MVTVMSRLATTVTVTAVTKMWCRISVTLWRVCDFPSMSLWRHCDDSFVTWSRFGHAVTHLWFGRILVTPWLHCDVAATSHCDVTAEGHSKVAVTSMWLEVTSPRSNFLITVLLGISLYLSTSRWETQAKSARTAVNSTGTCTQVF